MHTGIWEENEDEYPQPAKAQDANTLLSGEEIDIDVRAGNRQSTERLQDGRHRKKPCISPGLFPTMYPLTHSHQQSATKKEDATKHELACLPVVIRKHLPKVTTDVRAK